MSRRPTLDELDAAVAALEREIVEAIRRHHETIRGHLDAEELEAVAYCAVARVEEDRRRGAGRADNVIPFPVSAVR